MHERSGSLAVEQGFAPFTDEVASEPFPKRVRARWRDHRLLETGEARLAWIEGPTPDYAIPWEDVHPDLASAGEAREHEHLGTVEPVALSAGGAREDQAGVRVLEPPESAPGLADHAVFDWSAVDAWFVEDERQRVHPRDPYRRIDVRDSSRRVVVEVGDEVLADSRASIAVFETGLPVRFYLSELDVRTDRLEPSDTVTRCAYKGRAEHLHVDVPGRRIEDGAWRYPSPEPGFTELQDRICFYVERVDRVIVDGEERDPPETPWW